MSELGQPLEGFLVQEMVEGVEMLVGVTHDDVFGPIVVCGAEARRRAFTTSPPGGADRGRGGGRDGPIARHVPAARRLSGRSAGGCKRLGGHLLRVSALASERESVMEMDCNPVMVRQKGAVVVDARVRVASRKRPRHPAQPVGLELHGGNRGL